MNKNKELPSQEYLKIMDVLLHKFKNNKLRFYPIEEVIKEVDG